MGTLTFRPLDIKPHSLTAGHPTDSFRLKPQILGAFVVSRTGLNTINPSNSQCLTGPTPSHISEGGDRQKSAKRSQLKASRKLGAIHSGEVGETKGGNHKTIEDWKAQYGAQEVESWLAQYDLRVQTKGSSRGLFYATAQGAG